MSNACIMNTFGRALFVSLEFTFTHIFYAVSHLCEYLYVVVSGISQQAWSEASCQSLCLSFFKCWCSLAGAGLNGTVEENQLLCDHTLKNHSAQPCPS